MRSKQGDVLPVAVRRQGVQIVLQFLVGQHYVCFVP